VERVTGDLVHTHAPGNVGLRGEASCPACRAEGITLAEEQRALVDELLAPLADAGDVFYTTAGQDAVRVALIEAILRSAEQQEQRDRDRLTITATAYEQNSDDLIGQTQILTASSPDRAALLADAARYADRAATLRRAAR
jgi:hypothetical protein